MFWRKCAASEKRSASAFIQLKIIYDSGYLQSSTKQKWKPENINIDSEFCFFFVASCSAYPVQTCFVFDFQISMDPSRKCYYQGLVKKRVLLLKITLNFVVRATKYTEDITWDNKIFYLKDKIFFKSHRRNIGSTKKLSTSLVLKIASSWHGWEMAYGNKIYKRKRIDAPKLGNMSRGRFQIFTVHY